MAKPTDTVLPGASVNLLAEHVGRHPDWLRFINQTALKGNAEGFGIQLINYGNGGTGASKTYLVAPNMNPMDYYTLGGDELNVVIMEPTARELAFFYRDNGERGYLSCEVRVAKDVPARAIVKFPRQYGDDNILAEGFKWSPPAGGGASPVTGPVKRGFLLLVYKGNELIFGGRIREIDKGEAITVTAYDRLMDLGLFSAQYQPNTGTHYYKGYSTARGQTSTYWRYSFPEMIGTIDFARTINLLRISSIDDETNRNENIDGFFHSMPWAYDDHHVLVEPVAGDVLKRLRVRFSYSALNERPKIKFIVGYFNVVTGEYMVLSEFVPETDVGGQSHQYVEINYRLPEIGTDTNLRYFVGVFCTRYYNNCYFWGLDSNETVTSGETYAYTNVFGVPVPMAWDKAWFPEIEVDFLHDGTVVTSSVTADGSQALLPAGSVPAGPTGDHLTTLDPAIVLYLEFYISNTLAVREIVRDLLNKAGLWDYLEGLGYEDLGTIDYYSTGSHDWLTCIRELIEPLNLGLVTDENGMVVLAPHASIESGAVLTASTENYGAGIISHSLTRKWMATADVMQVVTEDVNGTPWGIESDDLLLPDPYIDDMGIMRAVESDRSLGTPGAQAGVAGGRIRQAHYNIIEGEVVLAGYYTELWNFFSTCARYPAINNGVLIPGATWPIPNYSGGNPFRIVIPDEDVDEVAVPTEITFKNGTTIVKLDNIRAADRSDIAQSMGLTADLVSDSALINTVYIHARAWSYNMQETGVSPGILTGSVHLYDAAGTEFNGVTWANGTLGYDLAGYTHAVLTGTATASTTSGITVVSADCAPYVEMYADVDVPIPILNAQKVVVDIRFVESIDVPVPRLGVRL